MISLLNWFSQVASITLVNLRTLTERKGSALAAAVGIAGVVAVLVGVLSIAEGFRYAMKPAGADDVALILRSGADSEMTSGLSREDTRVIADAPGLARDESGALASPELFVIINLPKRSTGSDANVPLRGVGPAAFTVRDGVKLVAGRRFKAGRNEVVVGAGAARAFAGLDVGHTIRVGANDWEVVGVFTAGGGAAESEIWSDAAVLQPAYHRADSFQSVLAKLRAPETFQQFKNALEADPRVRVDPHHHAHPDDRHGGGVVDDIGRAVRCAQYDVRLGFRPDPRDRDAARPGFWRRRGGLLGAARIDRAGAGRRHRGRWGGVFRLQRISSDDDQLADV